MSNKSSTPSTPKPNNTKWLHPFLLQRVFAFSSKNLDSILRNSNINAEFAETAVTFGVPIIELLYESCASSYWSDKFPSSVCYFFERLASRHELFVSSMWLIDNILEAASRIDFRRVNGLTYEGLNAASAPAKAKPKKRKIIFSSDITIIEQNANGIDTLTVHRDSSVMTTSDDDSAAATSGGTACKINNSDPKSVVAEIISHSIDAVGTIVHMAAEVGALDLLRKLKSMDETIFLKVVRQGKGASTDGVHDPKQCDNDIRNALPPIFLAAQGGHRDVVLFLVRECGIDPFVILKSGKTILHSLIIAAGDKTRLSNQEKQFDGGRSVVADDDDDDDDDHNSVSPLLTDFFMKDLGFQALFDDAILKRQKHSSSSSTTSKLDLVVRPFLLSKWKCELRARNDVYQWESNINYSNHCWTYTPLLLAIAVNRAGDAGFVMNLWAKLTYGASFKFHLLHVVSIDEAYDLFQLAAYKGNPLALDLLFASLQHNQSNTWRDAFDARYPGRSNNNYRQSTEDPNLARRFLAAVVTPHPPRDKELACFAILESLKVLVKWGFDLAVGAEQERESRRSYNISYPLSSFMREHTCSKGALDVVKFWIANTKPEFLRFDSTQEALLSIFMNCATTRFRNDKNASPNPLPSNEIIDFFLDVMKVNPNGGKSSREAEHPSLLPIEAAIRCNHIYGVKKLLERGADFYPKNAGQHKQGQLLLVLQQDNPQLLRMYLEHIVRINGRLFVADELLNTNVSIKSCALGNIASTYGAEKHILVSPFYFLCNLAAYSSQLNSSSALKNSAQMAEILLQCGADPTLNAVLTSKVVITHGENVVDALIPLDPILLLIFNYSAIRFETSLEIAKVLARFGRLKDCLKNARVEQSGDSALHILGEANKMTRKEGEEEIQNEEARRRAKELIRLFVKEGECDVNVKNRKGTVPDIAWALQEEE